MALPQYRISLVRVGVRDLDRAVAFYRDVLHFDSPAGIDDGRVRMIAGDQRVELVLIDPAEPVGGRLAFELSAHDLETVSARAAGWGAVVAGGVLTSQGGRRYIDVRDPDGNVLRIVEER